MCGKKRERARRSRILPKVFRLYIGLKFAKSDFGRGMKLNFIFNAQ